MHRLRHIPFTFLLHGVDMLDIVGDILHEALSICPTLRKRFAERKQSLNLVLQDLKTHYDIVRTKDYVVTLS
jgi:hypothetical protein